MSISLSVNLIPDELFVGKAIWRRRALWGMIFGATLVGLTTASLALRHHLQRQDAALDPLRTRVTAMADWETGIAPLYARLTTAHEQQRVVDQLLRKPDWSGLLASIAKATHAKLWLTSITTQEDPSTAGSLPTMAIEINGIAHNNADISTFVSEVRQSAQVASLAIAQTHAHSDQHLEGVVKFTLRGSLQ